MNFARAILTVSSMTVVSRISGFVRDTLSANIIGAGPVADAFFVALRLPNLFRSLFAEGAFSAAFVPLYAKAMKEGDAALARQFTAEALSVLSVFLLPFTALMILFMPWVMHVIAPGFEDKPEIYNLAVTYAQITFPYLFLISGVALLSGVLNSNKRFAPGAAAPIAFNILLIAALLLAKPMGQDPGLMMAIAVTLSGIVQWVWMHLHCKALGVDPPFLMPRLTMRVKELFKQVGPGALGAGAAQINLALSTILASLLPTGAVSYLFYADRLNQLPLGVIGIAISTTLLPLLSARVQKNDTNGIRHYTTRALEFGLILGLPAALGLSVSALPIITVLFEHGAFTANDSHNTALALAAYSLGVVPFILIKVLSTLFFAHHNTRTPVKIALVAVAFNICMALALLKPMGHAGIALATSCATWVNCLLLMLALSRAKLLVLDHVIVSRVVRIVLSSLVMAGMLYVGLDPVVDLIAQHGKLVDIAVLGAYLLLAFILYIVALRLTGAMNWAEVKAIINRKDEA
jgi:putative peptidoglycan lipid II flippase